MSFVGRLLGGGRRPDPQPLRLSLEANEARRMIIGRAGVAGTFGFHGTSPRPSVFNVRNNDFLHQNILLAGHRCAGVPRIWGNGDLVRSQPLQHGVETEIPEYRDGRRARLWVTWFDGRPNQTANPTQTGSNVQPVRPRASDRLSGISYISVRSQFDRDVLTTPVEWIFEVDGGFWYDRRRDSTAGGDGPQRFRNPASWGFTNNPAVVADHYQLGVIGGANNDQFIFGMGLEPWQVPFEEFQANADLCDERVPLSFGREQTRYAANGVLRADSDHQDNISALSKAMAAQPYDTGGRIIIRPAQARPIVMTLTDADLVSGEPYMLDPTPSGTDLINTVRGSYREPANKHNEQEYPLVQDEEQVANDGRAFEHTLDLDLETNGARAQRLASIELEVQQRRDVLEETFMPIANRLEVGDWFERVSNLRGPVTKIFEVTNLVRRADLTVEVTARETDPAIVAFNPSQARPIELPDPLPPLTGFRPPAPEFTPSPQEREGGGATGPVVLIEVVPQDPEDLTDVDFFELQFGISNGLEGSELGIAQGLGQILRFSGSETNFELTGLMPSTTYAYRIRAVRGGLTGDYGAFMEVTTTNNFVATAARNAVPGSPLAGQIKTIETAAANANSAAESARRRADEAFEGASTVAGDLQQTNEEINSELQRTNVQVAGAFEAIADQEEASAREVEGVRASFARRGELVNGSFEQGPIESGPPEGWPLSTQNTPGLSTVQRTGQFATGRAARVEAPGGVNTSFRQSVTVTPAAFYDLQYTLDQLSGDASGSGVLLVWRNAAAAQVQPVHRSRIRFIPDTEGDISVNKMGVRTFYERVQVPAGAVRVDVLVGTSGSLGPVNANITEFIEVVFKPTGGAESLAVQVTEANTNDRFSSIERDEALQAGLDDANSLIFQTQQAASSSQASFAQDIAGLQVSLQDAETRRLLSTFPTDFTDRNDWSPRNVGRPEDKLSDSASLYLESSPNGFGRHFGRTGARSVYAKNAIPFDTSRGLSWAIRGFVDTLDPNGNSDNNLLGIALDEDLQVIGGRLFWVNFDIRARLRPSARGEFSLLAELGPDDLARVAEQRPGIAYLVLGAEVNRGSSVGRTELWTASFQYSEGLASIYRIREATFNEDGSSVRQVIGGSVPGADVAVTLEAVNENGNALGRVGLAADVLTLFNRAAGVFSPALQILNGVSTFFGALNALAGIFVGSGRWPVALQSRQYALLDGESVEFGFNFGSPADISYSTSALPALGEGEAYNIMISANDGSGFMMTATRSTPGVPTNRVRTVDAVGSGNLDRQMNAITAQEAFDGIYEFEFTTLVFTGDTGLGSFSFGNVNVEIFIHDGTAFRLVRTVLASATSNSPGLAAFTQTVQVDYGGPVRNSGVAFGIAVTDSSNGQRVSDLRRVKYITQTQSSVSSATSGGQRVIVTATPRNA